MRDNDSPPPMAQTRPPSRFARWGQRLETTKVNVFTVVLFIGALALLCAFAAGVGYVAHHLRR